MNFVAANFKLLTFLSVGSNICLFVIYWMKFSVSVHWNENLCKTSENRLIFVVTPTYERLMQMASMTNLMQTLRQVPPPVHWIVIEDNEKKSDRIKKLLKRSGLQYTHLAIVSPVRNPNAWDTKAARQRSYALEYIRLRFAAETNALIYFADDDNIYDVRLFDLIRQVIINYNTLRLNNTIHIIAELEK